jgi:Tol biopolymer transport system component
MRLPPTTVLAAVITALLALPVAAQAAYPGGNGKVAFARAGQIWTINPNGSGATQLTTGASPSTEPEWSPDGTRIAYTRTTGGLRELRVMNGDGTGDHHVYGPGAQGAFSPTWSPDGRQLAFVLPNGASPLYDIWVAGSDASSPAPVHAGSAPAIGDLEWSPLGDEVGFTRSDLDVGETDAVLLRLHTQGLQLLTIDPDETSAAPAWSPDGDSLALLSDLGVVDYEVWTTNRAGTTREQITNTGAEQNGVDWSPDGTKLVLSSGVVGCSGNCDAGLYVMNPDGSGLVTLVDTPSSEASPDWQPTVGAPPPGYPRPRGATPTSVPLVPAYVPCAAPNRTHGAPLAFGSCSPPSQASPNLTLGTPDANGAPVRSNGSVRIDAMLGNSSTEANEADVKFTVSVTDVRCHAGDTRSICTDANTQAGRDYAGGLRVRFGLRLTDRYNLPAPGGDQPGTMSDTPVELNLEACSSTPADPAAGSTCSLTTGSRALLGVTEDRRAIMQLGQVEVLDGGFSGEVSPEMPSSGMSTFLRQGLFVP